MLQERRPCVPIREQNSTENYRTWNNAVQVATCRSWAVNVTQDWSISWMAKRIPYSIVLLPVSVPPNESIACLNCKRET